MTDEVTQELAVEVDVTGDDLTLNEKVDIINVCGGTRTFVALRDECDVPYQRALLWVLGRRSNPNLSLHDAGDVKVRLDG